MDSLHGKRLQVVSQWLVVVALPFSSTMHIAMQPEVCLIWIYPHHATLHISDIAEGNKTMNDLETNFKGMRLRNS